LAAANTIFEVRMSFFAPIRALVVAVLALLVVAIPSAAWAQKDCSHTHTDRIPINDLGTGFYLGFQGGLYPGGSNVRPLSQEQALDRTGRMLLLDADGNPDPVNGKFVLVGLGNSNAQQEWVYFVDHAATEPDKNTKLVIVNGAQIGMNADEISDPESVYWHHVDEAVQAAGVTTDQIQAIWFEESIAYPTDVWPTNAQVLLGYFRTIMQIVKSRWPHVNRV
jgi:hypothetical protein